MKKGIILFTGVMIFVLLFAGFSASDAKATNIYSPREQCNSYIDKYTKYGWILPGSHYDPIKEQCIYGWNVDGKEKNKCYPLNDVYQVDWGFGSYATETIFLTRFYFKFVGCAPKVQNNGHYIKDPNLGNADLGDGVSFKYQNQTCANGCNITKFGLTGAAKRAIKSVPGKVINKTYVQIKDDKGALTTGEFSLCFYAKGVKNPYFFRFGGGSTWAPMGGYWKGDNFCMGGSLSGNYVLVNMP